MIAKFATSALLGCAVAVEFKSSYNDDEYSQLLYTLKGNPDLSKQLLQAVADAHGYHDTKFYDAHDPKDSYGHYGPVFAFSDLSEDSDVHYHVSDHHDGYHSSDHHVDHY